MNTPPAEPPAALTTKELDTPAKAVAIGCLVILLIPIILVFLFLMGKMADLLG